MAIEIGEMLIKSSVLKEEVEAPLGAASPLDEDALKQDILSDCKALMAELLREHKER